LCFHRGKGISGRRLFILYKHREPHLLKLAAATTTARRRHKSFITPPLALLAGLLEEEEGKKTSDVARLAAPREARAETPRARTGAATMDGKADIVCRCISSPSVRRRSRAQNQWSGQYVRVDFSHVFFVASFPKIFQRSQLSNSIFRRPPLAPTCSCEERGRERAGRADSRARAPIPI
jgi:hypothetical protein